MSLWGAKPEENDDAADWLMDLEDEPEVVTLNDAFDEVLLSDEYLEVTECANAVAAAAVVAEVFKQASSPMVLEAETRSALKDSVKQLDPGARVSLLERAIASVRVVMNDIDRSELYQMAHEDQALAKPWLRQMQGLERRLLRASAALADASKP